MNTNVRDLYHYKVLDISEPARQYEDICLIRDTLESLVDGGTRFIAINLIGVPYIHSFFIKILTATYKKLKAHGGNICLIGPNQFVRELIHLLNIDDYLTLFENEDAFRVFLSDGKE